jgi:AAA domain
VVKGTFDSNTLFILLIHHCTLHHNISHAQCVHEAAEALSTIAAESGGAHLQLIREVLHNAHFVFCTLNTCGRTMLTSMPPPDVLIVDEGMC